MGFSFFSSLLVPTLLAHRDATEEDTVVGRTLSSRALIPILSWRVYVPYADTLTTLQVANLSLFLRLRRIK